jgi:hypothetical protein
MDRRTYLASLTAGLAALAGCPDGDPGTEPASPGGSTPTSSVTPTATGTLTATPGDDSTPAPEVTVETLHLQYGYVAPDSPDSVGISNPSTPYLVAGVAVDGALDRGDFVVEVGDQAYTPTTPDRFYRTDWGDDHWYEAGRADGLVLFELPTEVGREPRLAWPGGERALGDDARARIDRGPPDLSVTLDVPETHAGMEAPPVSVAVTNDNDLPAYFLGALNRTGPLVAYTPVTRLGDLVAAGETVTIDVADEWTSDTPSGTVGDDDPDVRYFLHYGDRRQSADIRLVDTGRQNV